MVRRGIVVCPSYALAGRQVSLDAAVSPQELRRYLLYWDRLAYAFPNGFGAPNLDALHDLRFLRDEGLLCLRDVAVTGADVGADSPASTSHISQASGALFETTIPSPENPSGVRALGLPVEVWQEMNYLAPLRAAAQLQEEDGSPWSVAQTGQSFVLPRSPGPQAPLLEAAICAALPIPDEATPLDEILQFKSKRLAELLRLRNALDSLRDRVLRAEDMHRGFAATRDELEVALADIYRTLSESQIRSFFTTLRLYLDLSDNKLAATVIAAFGAQGVGLPLEVGGAIGLAVSTGLTFAARMSSPPPPLASDLRDYRYLYEVTKYWPPSAQA